MARTSQERKRHQATAAAGVLDRAAAAAARAGARGKAPARPRRAPQTAAGNGRDPLHREDTAVAEPSLSAGRTETAEAPIPPLDPPIAEPPGQENLVPPDAAGSEPAAQERAAPHPLHGYIDEASWTGIKGWVWDPQLPTERIRLELMEGETRLATALASENRPGLILSGIGDGRHGFSIALAAGALQEGRHVLRLRSADTGAEVPGSPIVLEPNLKSAGPQDIAAATDLAAPAIGEVAGAGFAEAAQPWAAGLSQSEAVLTSDLGGVPPVGQFADPPPLPAAAAGLVSPDGETLPATLRRPRRAEILAEPAPELPAEPLGSVVEGMIRAYIDYADWTGIRGWIWDPEMPEKRILLEVLDGDNRLATVVASEYRADLVEAGVGDGRHGFSIPLSETLLPYARHILHLRPVGSTFELPSFPLVLTREQVGFDTSVLRFLHGNVMAETARAQQPDDLAPMITNLVEVLDQALSHYYVLAAEKAALNTADVLNPADFSPQVQILIESIQRNYPPIVVETDAKPVVSIIIPVFNKFDLTYQCIKSIEEHGAKIPYEIIIVDDCSRDETVLASWVLAGGVRLVRNTANSGFVRTCNRGFEAARGEYIVFLNNDTQVKPGWLDELYETLCRDPKVGIAGSKLLYPDGRLQECGGIIWRMGDGWNWGRDQDASDPRFCYMRDSDYVSGAALMIKSSLFDEIGHFDEHYVPAYYEDTDLCFKVRSRGYRTVVQPASEIVHFEGASAGTSVTGSGMKRFQAINHRKFFDRWKDTLASHRFNGEMPELEAERSVRQRALMIDDSVPEPDKDAGSNAAFQHILTLQRLGYKVTFIPGDNMAKIDPYTTDLQRRGVECLYHPYYFSVEDVFRKRPVPFDLVYLHRYSNASKYGGMIRQHFPQARILYNVADLHFLRLQRQAEVEDDPVLRQKAEQMRRLELGAMFFVDCVIVHSAAEAELLAKMAPGVNVQVIPWTIEVRDIKKVEVERPAIAFIGGYRHEPNIDAAKWAVQSIMPGLRKQVPGIELLLVGSYMPPELTALAGKDVVPLGHVPSLDNVFDRVRLTIAPLRYGAGLKGKVLESLAAGVPCVMTTVAAEGLDLPKKLQVLVADEPGEIAARIAKLCRDDAEYRRIVEAGKAYVAATYSAERIDGLLRQACAAE
jgi:GT2 family glycosyltransferase/glycosyltransferase involved in cell wall biosynthesis